MGFPTRQMLGRSFSQAPKDPVSWRDRVCGVGAARAPGRAAPYSSYRFSNSRHRSRFAVRHASVFTFTQSRDVSRLVGRHRALRRCPQGHPARPPPAIAHCAVGRTTLRRMHGPAFHPARFAAPT